MEQVLTVVVVFIMTVSFFIVVGVLLPGSVKTSRGHFEKTPGRAFQTGLIYVLVLLALFAGSVTLVRSTGLGFLNLIPLLVMLVFAYGAVVGLTAVSQSVGERAYPDHKAYQKNAYGAALVILASAIPYLGWAILFPYLLISGFGAAAIAFNESRKQKKTAK